MGGYVIIDICGSVGQEGVYDISLCFYTFWHVWALFQTHCSKNKVIVIVIIIILLLLFLLHIVSVIIKYFRIISIANEIVSLY